MARGRGGAARKTVFTLTDASGRAPNTTLARGALGRTYQRTRAGAGLTRARTPAYQRTGGRFTWTRRETRTVGRTIGGCYTANFTRPRTDGGRYDSRARA